MTTHLADSGINDRLVKLYPLIHQTCFEFTDINYFGAVNFLIKIYTNCLKIDCSCKGAVVCYFQGTILIIMIIITALCNNLEHLCLVVW